jgi:hypothetical protein
MGSLLCLLFLIWSGVFFYFDLCSKSATSCSILIIAVLASNGSYLLVLATRCLKEWGKRNKSKLKSMAHTLHLDTFRVQKNEEEKKEEDGKVIEMMYHNPLGSKKGVKKIENISVIEVTL